MRRKYLVPTVLLLTLADAFSLGNFQAISSSLIPQKCSQEYNAQIPNCGEQDFNVICSDTCKRSLQQVEIDVTTACVGVILNPKSLLGIIKTGGIIPALCSNPGNPGSATSSTSRAPPAATTTPLRTTTTLQRTSTTAASSTNPNTSQSSTPPDSTTATVPSSSSRVNNQQPSTTSARASNVEPPVRASSTTTSSPAANSQSTSDSGGGSPFDISSAASRSESRSILSALVLGGWALGLLLR